MTTVEDLEKVLEETKPPKQLLKYFPGGCAPLYLFNAVVEQTGGKFHGQVCHSLLLTEQCRFHRPFGGFYDPNFFGPKALMIGIVEF